MSQYVYRNNGIPIIRSTANLYQYGSNRLTSLSNNTSSEDTKSESNTIKASESKVEGSVSKYGYSKSGTPLREDGSPINFAGDFNAYLKYLGEEKKIMETNLNKNLGVNWQEIYDLENRRYRPGKTYLDSQLFLDGKSPYSR